MVPQIGPKLQTCSNHLQNSVSLQLFQQPKQVISSCGTWGKYSFLPPDSAFPHLLSDKLLLIQLFLKTVFSQVHFQSQLRALFLFYVPCILFRSFSVLVLALPPYFRSAWKHRGPGTEPICTSIQADNWPISFGLFKQQQIPTILPFLIHSSLSCLQEQMSYFTKSLAKIMCTFPSFVSSLIMSQVQLPNNRRKSPLWVTHEAPDRHVSLF